MAAPGITDVPTRFVVLLKCLLAQLAGAGKLDSTFINLDFWREFPKKYRARHDYTKSKVINIITLIKTKKSLLFLYYFFTFSVRVNFKNLCYVCYVRLLYWFGEKTACQKWANGRQFKKEKGGWRFRPGFCSCEANEQSANQDNALWCIPVNMWNFLQNASHERVCYFCEKQILRYKLMNSFLISESKLLSVILLSNLTTPRLIWFWFTKLPRKLPLRYVLG